MAISGTFVPTFRDNISAPLSRAKNSETSVGNYRYSLRNRPEDRSFQVVTLLKLIGFSSDVLKYFGTNEKRNTIHSEGKLKSPDVRQLLADKEKINTTERAECYKYLGCALCQCVTKNYSPLQGQN